jgi:hypothetical protein
VRRRQGGWCYFGERLKAEALVCGKKLDCYQMRGYFHEKVSQAFLPPCPDYCSIISSCHEYVMRRTTYAHPTPCS